MKAGSENKPRGFEAVSVFYNIFAIRNSHQLIIIYHETENIYYEKKTFDIVLGHQSVCDRRVGTIPNGTDADGRTIRRKKTIR